MVSIRIPDLRRTPYRGRTALLARHQSGTQKIWIQIPVLSQAAFVTLSKTLNLSTTEVTICKMGTIVLFTHPLVLSTYTVNSFGQGLSLSSASGTMVRSWNR